MATLFELKDKIESGAKIRREIWNENSHISAKKDSIFSTFATNNNTLYSLSIEDLYADDWEEYKGVDYLKCIGCLCKFYNTDSDNRTIYYGILLQTTVSENETTYISHNNCSYRYCEPIRYNEVKFYEDIENESN